MLAMASNSHNDRLQARERRNRVPPAVNLAGTSMEPAQDDGGLFPVPAVRVKRENDELSNRMKGLFEPLHNFSNSPIHSRMAAPSASHMMSHPRGDSLNRPPDHIQQAAEKHSPVKSKESKKKSDGSEQKHKHKERDKEKKRKSSHSDEKHAKKKSKTTDKTHSPAIKDPSSVSISKKITHRSSSVSSDRSDLSVKSKSSTDKQYTSIKPPEHVHSKVAGSKSKQSSGSTAHLHPTSVTSSSMIHGASESSKGASHKYTNSSSYEHSNGMNTVPTDMRNQMKSKDKDRLPNGLARPGSKPTNLVIPSVNPSQSAGLKNDKDDLPVKSILAEMMVKPTERITEIQTPSKSYHTSPYPFTSLSKPIEQLGDPHTTKSSKSKLSNSITETTKEKSSRPSGEVKPDVSSSKPAKLPNGVVDDLKLSPSNADSESNSSSSSNSSDSSSSSSSSGSDSDSSDEEDVPKTVSKMFSGMESSPAPLNASDYNWNLENFYCEGDKPAQGAPSKKPDNKSTAPDKMPATTVAASKSINDTAGKGLEKRKRGRPRKEEAPKRNPDPDFTPPPMGGKHLPPAPSTVTTERKKRLPSSSKSKSDNSKAPTKRGRPRKKADEPTPSAVSTNKAITSVTLSIDRSTGKDSSIGETPLSSSTTKKPVAPLSSSSSVGDEDVDVDVDAISDQSPDDTPLFAPIKSADSMAKTEPKEEAYKREMKEEVSKRDAKEELFNKEAKEGVYDRLVPKHEPISPVDIKVDPFTHMTSPVAGTTSNNSVRSLLVKIPLSQLVRPPLRSSLLKKEPSEASLLDVPSLPGLKEEKLSSPALKRKSTPTSTFSQAMQEAKKRKPAMAESDDPDLSLDMTNPPIYSSGGKDGSRIPSYAGSHLYHEQARKLKNRCTSMPSNPDAKPLKHLLALEATVTFIMSGIGKEAEDPNNIKAIKLYYTSTLGYAESVLGECLSLKESNSTQPRIHKCSQVLCHFVLAHLKYKCYKLHKDQATSCGRRVDEFLHREKNKHSISPHTHTGLPPGNSPAAPSPASITSTGSLASDSGRGASLPPTNSSVAIPDTMLKDVGEYMKCMNQLASSTEQWKTAQLWRVQPEQKEFFKQLDKELDYSIDLLTESRPFVHYVHRGCLRLKKDLDDATSYS